MCGPPARRWQCQCQLSSWQLAAAERNPCGSCLPGCTTLMGTVVLRHAAPAVPRHAEPAVLPCAVLCCKSRQSCTASRCGMLCPLLDPAVLCCAALCCTVLQEQAELYCESLRLNGLISTIEPAGGGSGPDGTSSS